VKHGGAADAAPRHRRLPQSQRRTNGSRGGRDPTGRSPPRGRHTRRMHGQFLPV
jgi:hypothetical protein